MTAEADSQLREPVSAPIAGEPAERPLQGTALCLSGGGYRAMVFHLGALWRLNDAGVLARVDRFSSVSGGSITAAVLARAWNRLEFDASTRVSRRFEELVVGPVRALAGTTIDRGAILGGILRPRRTISDQVADAYGKRLFGDATLQDLPDEPRFVLNATNVQSGALWRFSKPYMADWRVGRIDAPRTRLAVAVAASSAFPPVLSPCVVPLEGAQWRPDEGELTGPEYRARAVLSDGGVYDNLGLETAWKRCRTVLVSDGGGQMAPDPKPERDWGRHGLRINSLLDHQVRNLRKRQVIASLAAGDRDGAYWGIRTNIAHYGLGDAFDCPHDATMRLAAIRTRLSKLDDGAQERLINWGFAVCDAALRAHTSHGGSERPASLPYPAAGIGA